MGIRSPLVAWGSNHLHFIQSFAYCQSAIHLKILGGRKQSEANGSDCLQVSFQDAQTWVIDCAPGLILGRIEVKHDHCTTSMNFSTCSHPGKHGREKVCGMNTRKAQAVGRDVVI